MQMGLLLLTRILLPATIQLPIITIPNGKFVFMHHFILIYMKFLNSRSLILKCLQFIPTILFTMNKGRLFR